MRDMRRIIQVATIVFVFVLWAPVGRARWSCWCVKPEVREAYDRAKVVFVGEVLEVIPPHSTDGPAKFADAAHTIRFKVERAWKGHFWTQITVLAQIQMDSCFSLRTPPQKGERYLVYAEPVYRADSSRTELMMQSCTRTALLTEISPASGFFYHNQALDDIRVLNNAMLISAPRRKPFFNLGRLNWQP